MSGDESKPSKADVLRALSNKRNVVVKNVQRLYDLAIAAGSQNATEKDRRNFLVRFEDLFNDVSKFEAFHFDIMGRVVDDLEIEAQDRVQTSFDDMQYAIKGMHRDMVESTKFNPSGSGVASNSNPGVQGDKCDRVRLPKIEIPRFNGDIKKWPTFFDMFRTLVHESSVLTNIEKFQFLVSYLEHDAAVVIKNIPITETNYQTAYDSLIKRYQNERVLITDYWLSVYQAPSLKSKSAIELRKVLAIFSENLAALDLFKMDLWDFTKFNLLFQKIDSSLKTAFEVEFSHKPCPKYTDLFEFLEKQCRALENSQLLSKCDLGSAPKPNQVDKANKSSPNSKQNARSGVGASAYSFFSDLKSNSQCMYCGEGAHSLIKCDKFLGADIDVRHSFIKSKLLCFNCLGRSHSVSNCTSNFSCRVCKKRHHTLLHFISRSKTTSGNPSSADSGGDDAPLNDNNKSKVLSSQSFSSRVSSSKTVLFATASVSLLDSQGSFVRCRALVDSASQANFISESCLRKLNLKPVPCRTPIQGVNQMSMCASIGNVHLKLHPYEQSEPSYNINAVVLPQICDAVPQTTVTKQPWKHILNLALADPDFNRSSDIDLLLGVEVLSEIVLPGLRKGTQGGPCALNTTLGWILFGSVESAPSTQMLACLTTFTSLDETLKMFWELEKIPETNIMSPEDQQCETLFSKHHSRDPTGRYIVELPFVNFPPCLGDSRTQAMRRFQLLERRLGKDLKLKALYADFMQDYLDQGHMSLVASLRTPTDGYFIPHHGVVKDNGGEKRIRVVFDGSAKSTNGSSLNDCLLTGPKLQNDITTILLNFRVYPVVVTADIRQMYRQILVADEHRDYQRILWRFSDDEPIQEYQLHTVTYGLSPSPFLAIRSLLQLVNDHGAAFPLAAKVIRHNTYVDDLICGSFSVSQALELQQQLIQLLSHACLELRKWSSNHQALLESVPVSDQQTITFSDTDVTGLKVLGLQWSPETDCFSYCVRPSSQECTKRVILSEIARIYDPIGFLAPTVLVAKHLIQRLWLLGLDWDAPPPRDICDSWVAYRDQLHCLSSLSIPRQLIADEQVCAELHGFCDASEVAYAGVVYMKQTLPDNKVVVTLVCAKTRVSPLKRISIPRLELCAAALLADCIAFVLTQITDVKFSKVYAWSDSTVALAWIKSPPHKWKTFVANRVSKIQDSVDPGSWNYVDGRQNPADCASRGVFPNELVSHSLWWAGPLWLQSADYPLDTSLISDTAEEAVVEHRRIVCVARAPLSLVDALLLRYSSFKRLQRVLALCQRFIHNLRSKIDLRQTEPLCTRDLSDAQTFIVKTVQATSFASDISCLQNGLPCSKPIQKLAPFLDDRGLLRVGGRLRNADISYDAKHPILLPRSHRLTDLIIQNFHNENLHPGPRALQYLISQQFWILSIRRAIRSVLSKCYRCFRLQPSSLTPFMGDLPTARVAQVKAFTHSGVDFAGPISIVLGRHRGVRSQKCYICVFICLATKAVHLEAVSDLTSNAFLAALRRFIARRGRCTDLYSDRGTNFVGANNLLQTFWRDSGQEFAIKWHFNPPAAPHFGGIWESAVRSVKTHLLRVIGCQVLSFEELMTLLTQIEALLNSRPLCSMSPDPNDLSSLSPGHFLTLEPLAAPPDEYLLEIKTNRLTRWQLVQQLHQHFWKRWHLEYLHTLQQREKWNSPQNSPTVGTLVVLKENNLPPLKWVLGRIVKVYPSPDQVARIAQIKTSKGLFDRPLVKLCPLPNQ